MALYCMVRCLHSLILNGCNHVGGRQKQPHDDENGNHCPGQLHLVATVYLWRLAAVIIVSVSELHY
jgi:hypothetical protein